MAFDVSVRALRRVVPAAAGRSPSSATGSETASPFERTLRRARRQRAGSLVATAVIAGSLAAVTFACRSPSPSLSDSSAPRFARGGTPPAARDAAAPPTRIVSLVPAVTDILFAIGAGPAVVGASSFDVLPPGAAGIARVGGLLDPDTERILALRPDVTIVYATQLDLVDRLRRAGLTVRPYRHGGLADAVAEIRSLGALVGRGREAEALAADIERRLEAVRRAVASRPRPRVLVVFGRERGTLRTVYASGGRGFIHDLVETAGGRNVFGDVPRENVQATAELVLAAAPEVIVELRADPLPPDEAERERAVWSALAAVPAVRNGRVHLLAGRELVVPGPRLGEAAERLARALHPGAVAPTGASARGAADAERRSPRARAVTRSGEGSGR